jgi:hypothetical protein
MLLPQLLDFFSNVSLHVINDFSLQGPIIPFPTSDLASFLLKSMEAHLNNDAFISEQYQQKHITFRELIAQVCSILLIFFSLRYFPFFFIFSFFYLVEV